MKIFDNFLILFSMVIAGCSNSTDTDPVDVIDSESLANLVTLKNTYYNRNTISQWYKSITGNESWK